MSNPSPLTIPKTVCDSWPDFKVRVFSDLYGDTGGRFVRGKYLFRGQGSARWFLDTTYDRWYLGPEELRLEIADRLLDQFIVECEREDLPDRARDDRALMRSLAQHHGLPTRLLDWSQSPYVAAFFAFSGHLIGKRGIVNLEKHV